MYVYIYIYVYIHIYLYIYTNICTYTSLLCTLSTCHLDPVASCESPYQTPRRPRTVHIACTSLGVSALGFSNYVDRVDSKNRNR